MKRNAAKPDSIYLCLKCGDRVVYEFGGTAQRDLLELDSPEFTLAVLGIAAQDIMQDAAGIDTGAEFNHLYEGGATA